jgi:hypothetical protein
MMKRPDLKGKVRVFSISDASQFLQEGDEPHKLFSAAERQRFVTIAMDGVRITPTDVKAGLDEIPGTSIKVSEGMPVVQSLRSQGVIKQLFYLHNPEKAKTLFKTCAKLSWDWQDGKYSSSFLTFGFTRIQSSDHSQIHYLECQFVTSTT